MTNDDIVVSSVKSFNSDFILETILKQQAKLEDRISRFESEIKSDLDSYESKIEKILSELIKVSSETQKNIYELRDEFNNKITDVRELNQTITSDVSHLKKTEDKLGHLQGKISEIDRTVENYNGELKIVERNTSNLNRLFEKVNELKNIVERNKETLNDIADKKERRRSEVSQIRGEVIAGILLAIAIGGWNWLGSIEKDNLIKAQEEEILENEKKLIDSQKEIERINNNIIYLIKEIQENE